MHPRLLIACLLLTFSKTSGTYFFSQPQAGEYEDVRRDFFRVSPSISAFHSIKILHICFDRNLLPIPRSRPTLKLSILLLLAGDVSLNPGPVGSNIKLATLNARSVRNKSAPLADLVKSRECDILSLTETWLKPSDTVGCLADITPAGYTLVQTPRSHQRGGVSPS